MEKLILKLISFIAILSLTACGGGTATDITGIDSFTPLAGSSFSKSDSDTLSGIGAVRFISPLNGVLSNNSLALKTQLDGTLYASTTVIFNSNDLNVANNSGIAIKFVRNGINVTASVGVNGTWVTVDSSITNAYMPLSLDLIIDIHNNTGNSNKTRVLIWRRTYTPYSAASADLDTNSAGDISGAYPASAQAAGTFAGLRLDNSTVTAASVGTAKVID
ncbi:MAG: hypothetical protein J7501_02365 [Bdellovibrio sp.]|nr:hypothetical protein [Bdellovibrio sp.]